MIPNELSALAAARAIAEGSMSSRALTEACLARIDQRELGVGAWQFLDSSYACAQADACDALQRAGRPLGPLHGVPVGVKDIIDTSDMPTENGTVLCAGRRPARDATVVSRLSCGGRDHPGQDGDGRAGRRPPWQTRLR